MAIREYDHYVDAETGVLKNLFGITDQDMLDEVESSIVAWRSYELYLNPPDQDYGFNHLKEIHRRLFQDLYSWAGEVRNSDIMLENSFFAHYPYINSAGQKIFGDLAREKYLQGLDEETFSERAAYYMGEINALHPFRDGNGRVQREFMRQLAAGAGYELDWTNVSVQEMNQAAAHSFQGDSSDLAKIILYNITSIPLETQDITPKKAMSRKGRSFDL